MITVDEALALLRGHAQDRWLRWALGQGAWPHRIALSLPSGADLADNIVTVQNSGDWRRAAEAREVPGELIEVTRRVLDYGPHTLPEKLVIASAEDALTPFPDLLDKYHTIVSRLTEAIAHSDVVWMSLPEVPKRCAKIISELDDTDWSTALTVVDYLARNPPADMMVRQLAVPGVNTKWIEQHANLLVALVCPPDVPRIGADSLAQLQHHFRLRAKDTMINIALRCAQLRATVGNLERFAASISVLNTSALHPDIVLITENAELLYTLTLDIDGLAIIHGLGKAVPTLAELQWLQTAERVLYWGDIDRAGLQCLATLRRTGIHVQPILMDLDTLGRFQHPQLPHRHPSQQLRDPRLPH